MATTAKCLRYGRKWTIPETLALQREFELLKWSIDEIAEQHRRSPEAIMRKLDQEGFADFNVLFSNYHDLNSHIPVTRKYMLQQPLSEEQELCKEMEDDEEMVEYVSKSELDALSKRVAELEMKLNAMQANLLS